MTAPAVGTPAQQAIQTSLNEHYSAATEVEMVKGGDGRSIQALFEGRAEGLGGADSQHTSKLAENVDKWDVDWLIDNSARANNLSSSEIETLKEFANDIKTGNDTAQNSATDDVSLLIDENGLIAKVADNSEIASQVDMDTVRDKSLEFHRTADIGAHLYGITEEFNVKSAASPTVAESTDPGDNASLEVLEKSDSHAKTVFTDGVTGTQYEINVNERGSQAWITNRETGDTTRLWGDPHIDVNGEHVADFVNNITFETDGGAKITVDTTEWKNHNGLTLTESLTITQGGFGATIDGIEGRNKGDVSVETGANGEELDEQAYDGITFTEREDGTAGWRAEESDQTLRDYGKQGLKEATSGEGTDYESDIAAQQAGASAPESAGQGNGGAVAPDPSIREFDVKQDTPGPTTFDFREHNNMHQRVVGDSDPNTFHLGGNNNYFDIQNIGADETINLYGDGWKLDESSLNDGDPQGVRYVNEQTGSEAYLQTDAGRSESFVQDKVQILGGSDAAGNAGNSNGAGLSADGTIPAAEFNFTTDWVSDLFDIPDPREPENAE